MRIFQFLMLILGFCFSLTTKSAEPALGFDLTNMNKTVKPGQDFYEYAVGGWLKRTTLPADKSSYGAFQEVEDHNSQELQNIFDELSTRNNWKKGSIEQQVADFYASGMNEALLERRGLAPLQKEMNALYAINDSTTIAEVLGKWHDRGVDGVFYFHVGQDVKESTRYLAYLNQGELGLPDRDYYLKNDIRSQDIRAKYLKYMAKILEMAGDKAANDSASNIMGLETKLAELGWSLSERRDPVKRYNIKNMTQLQELAPGFDWQSYFNARKIDTKEFCICQPSFFEGFGKLASSLGPADWRLYLRWCLIRSRVP